jgi:hypothetical protein
MGRKLITWVDLEGRYRTSSPAYNDGSGWADGMDEVDFLAVVWDKVKKAYGLADDHPHFIIERAVYRPQRAACCQNDFRYTGIPDAEGNQSAVGGAWEMDVDGLPKVNMPKARGVQMNHIRRARNTKLKVLDLEQVIAAGAGDEPARERIETQKQTLRDIPQTFDLTTSPDTPEELKAQWPTELSPRE